MSGSGKPKPPAKPTIPEAIREAIKAAFAGGYESAIQALDDIGKETPDPRARSAIRNAANLLKGMRP